MPSARTVTLSAVLFLPQLLEVTAIKVEYFSADGCNSANLKKVDYLPEGECFKDYSGTGTFMKFTCSASGAVGKYYSDMQCTTSHATADQTFPVNLCASSSGMWLKGSCGMGTAVKISREYFSDSGCTTATGNSTLYMDAGCTEMSQFSNNAWTSGSRKVEVSTATLKMDQYGSTDCSGAVATPSEATCMMCLTDGNGGYQRMSTDTCVGPSTTGTTVSSGTRASPLAIVAIVAVALLAR